MKTSIAIVLVCFSSVGYCCGTLATANGSPNACSSSGNGTYDCRSSRGISTSFAGQATNGAFRNELIQPAQPDIQSPTTVYNAPGQVNGGGVGPGTFDFRSSNMTHNGIQSAVEGRCPGVVRYNMVVYYDCTSEAMIRYARGQNRGSSLVRPEVQSGGL